MPSGWTLYAFTFGGAGGGGVDVRAQPLIADAALSRKIRFSEDAIFDYNRRRPIKPAVAVRKQTRGWR